MSRLCRRKAFIVVQEFKELKNTKDLLSSKLNLLINQFAAWINSENTQDSSLPEFLNERCLCISFRIKILQILLYLTNSSQLCWAFLQTLSAKDNATHILGSLKKPGFIIDTDRILKDTSAYFLSLYGLGIVDVAAWRNLTYLKNRSSSAGGLSLDDAYYYECKQLSILKPLEDLERFDYLEKELQLFLHKQTTLHEPVPIFCPLLNLTLQNRNHIVIRNFLHYYKFNYQEIRRDKEFRKKLDARQYQALADSLSYLNSFRGLYQTVAEFKLSELNAVSKELMACVLDYFFSQNESVLASEKAVINEKCFMEQLLRATLWVDFILYLCENRIPFSITKKLPYDTIYQNFARSCDMELSALKYADYVHLMMMFDVDSLELLIQKIARLKSNLMYRRYYSRHMDKYLSFNDFQKT